MNYKILQAGDVIRAGDECIAGYVYKGKSKWLILHPETYGYKLTQYDIDIIPHRRPIKNNHPYTNLFK